MDSSTKPSRTSAPYGQACMNCVRAKSRCMLREEGTCERSIYFTSGKQFLGMLSSLARSLVSDLRLDKPENPSLCPSIQPATVKVARSPESRRALLACFALSTIISTTFKYDSMPWLPQLDNDCNRLQADGASESDQILVAIVRASKMCLRAADVGRYLFDDPDSSRHVALHIGHLSSELDQFRSTLSGEQLQHSKTTVSINELAMLQPSSPSAAPSLILDFKRSDYLMACLEACRTCTDYFLLQGFLRVSGPIKLLFGYCIKVIFKLATFQDPIWNTAVVKESVDLLALLERCAVAAERANDTLKEETGEDSVFLIAAKTLRETAPQWRVPAPAVGMGDGVVGDGWIGNDGMDVSMMDFSDEFWLNAPFNL
ncbi:hypothetical protein EK21DRAFT_62946 [Setomelanomma holmii]|uniref:Zn(2)-C6 fungal-type domain-containing protein n=1 Tax=Setomelanomma holmii TaxID=210430 RepID=A0A9P4LN04_9PLEO|nr:hypothetical protein EK21DRAFT_62946 [Setomelanomma holmii]